MAMIGSAVGRELIPQTFITPAVLESIASSKSVKTECLRETLCRVVETLQTALVRRKGPKVDVIRFSVNLNSKGKVDLMRLEAVNALNSKGEAMMIVALPKDSAPQLAT